MTPLKSRLFLFNSSHFLALVWDYDLIILRIILTLNRIIIDPLSTCNARSQDSRDFQDITEIRAQFKHIY